MVFLIQIVIVPGVFPLKEKKKKKPKRKIIFFDIAGAHTVKEF